MEIVNFNRYDGQGSLKAFFDVETDEGITIKGFKVVDGSRGLFVSVPSEYSEKDSKYYDRVYLPQNLKDELEKDALAEYGE